MKKLKFYHVINENDANDFFEIEAESEQEATRLALQSIGWWVSGPFDASEDEDSE